MERKDVVTTWPMKVDGKPIRKEEVVLTGSPSEVAMIVMGLNSLLTNLNGAEPIIGSVAQRATETIHKLMDQVVTTTGTEVVELGPESLTEEFLQEQIRKHS